MYYHIVWLVSMRREGVLYRGAGCRVDGIVALLRYGQFLTFNVSRWRICNFTLHHSEKLNEGVCREALLPCVCFDDTPSKAPPKQLPSENQYTGGAIS